jgi:hypothetical protein
VVEQYFWSYACVKVQTEFRDEYSDVPEPNKSPIWRLVSRFTEKSMASEQEENWMAVIAKRDTIYIY